jgi:hypothetical protein
MTINVKKSYLYEKWTFFHEIFLWDRYTSREFFKRYFKSRNVLLTWYEKQNSIFHSCTFFRNIMGHLILMIIFLFFPPLTPTFYWWFLLVMIWSSNPRENLSAHVNFFLNTLFGVIWIILMELDQWMKTIIWETLRQSPTLINLLYNKISHWVFWPVHQKKISGTTLFFSKCIFGSLRTWITPVEANRHFIPTKQWLEFVESLICQKIHT